MAVGHNPFPSYQGPVYHLLHFHDFLMSLLWTSVSALLVIQLLVLLALCAPLPWGVRKNISRWIAGLNAKDNLRTFLRYVTLSLFLALAESVNSLRNVHIRREFNASSDSAADRALHMAALQDFKWQKARSERNLYLALFSITAMIVIARLVRLASIEILLRTKIKQYNGNLRVSESGEILKPTSKED